MNRNTRIKSRAGTIAAAAGAILAPGAAIAQPYWAINSALVDIDGNTFALEGCQALTDADAGNTTAFIALGNGDYMAVINLNARDSGFCGLSQSVVRANAYGLVRISGEGSRVFRVRWDLCSQPNAAAIENLIGLTRMRVQSAIDPVIRGPIFGNPVFVDYNWKQRGLLFTETEHLVCGNPLLPEGPLDVAGMTATLRFDNTELLGGRFTVNPPPGFNLLFTNELDFSGTFNRQVGNSVPIEIQQSNFADILFAGKGLYCGQDGGTTLLQGSIVMTLSEPGDPQPPPGDGCRPAFVEFSMDIGGDAELSDPNADGDEVFDPGDMYMRSAVASPLPFDGLWDDDFLFGGVDPQPDPSIPSAATPCAGQNHRQFALDNFDLDGHDALDTVITLPDQALDKPIDRFDSTHIFEVEYLTLSYDDDNPAHAANCDVPVNTPISLLEPGFGTLAGKDEVVGLTLLPIVPMATVSTFPIWSEEELHANMAPSPVAPFEDDDVDALDVRPDTQDGPLYWYFSADHEANTISRLDPGDVFVYDPAAGGVVRAIDDVLHLGIADSTDLRDFEFGWIYSPSQFPDNWKLVLVYAVAPDDPVTPGDESGGLDSKMLYYSFMTGASYPLLTQSLANDIDAVALYCSPLPGAAQRPCLADLSGSSDPTNPAYGVPDGQVDSSDFFYFLDQFVNGNLAVADMSGSSDPNNPLYGVPDGQIDSSDFFYFLDLFVAGCP